MVGSICAVGRPELWLAGSIGVASLIIVVGRLSLWLSCGFSEWLGLCGDFVMGCLSPRLCGWVCAVVLSWVSCWWLLWVACGTQL